jgi:4-hydroxy-tetrahydrodipicolinate synthase
MFTGIYTALVTPFKKGRLDETALKKLVELQVKGGVDGIVPVGTTGESPTVDFEEHVRIIELAVYYAKGRCKISQDGLYAHFSKIAKSTNLPIILYSIPGRCNVEIAVPTVVRLAFDCPNIVCIKEAGGDVDRVSQLRAALPRQFTILSGDDALTLPFMAAGAKGVISVSSNLIPRQLAKMVHAFLEGDAKGALKLHEKYYPLFKDLFIETNPVPVKAALAMKGLVAEEYRLPLVKMNPEHRRKLRATLKATGVLK